MWSPMELILRDILGAAQSVVNSVINPINLVLGFLGMDPIVFDLWAAVRVIGSWD